MSSKMSNTKHDAAGVLLMRHRRAEADGSNIGKLFSCHEMNGAVVS
jgi:hypothetical protein